MPTIEESKRQVKESLNDLKHDVDHDAILAALQDEIDSHNNDQHPRDISEDRAEERRSRKFRFKSSHSDHGSRRRKHRSKLSSTEHGPGHGRRSTREDPPGVGSSDEKSAHPFPREPTDASRAEYTDPNLAFRESLFDALADDEGAMYWESVYGQPIHTYPRPTVKTPKGVLEEMDDEQYAAYVQTKMWEKRHPHIVQERERSQKRKREEEEEIARQRAEYVRRKQRAAWERAQESGGRRFAGEDEEQHDDYEYVFDFEGKTHGASQRSAPQEDYRQAWRDYLTAWDNLKAELSTSKADDQEETRKPSQRIPWPVLASKPAVKSNIEAFMQHIVSEDGRDRLQLLKVERVRWHPDKVQQRFAGTVDDGTMKIVTGIFQVVDALVEDERKRAGH